MYSNNLMDHMPKNESWVVVCGMTAGHPKEAVWELFRHADEFKNGLYILGMHYTDVYPYHHNIKRYSAFFSPWDRESYRPSESGVRPSVIPLDVNFCNVGLEFKKFNPHLVITMATPPRRGRRSLGTNCDYILGLIESKIPVFVVENPNMPWTNGNQFSESCVVGVMQSDEQLITHNEKFSKTPDEDETIADRIIELLPERVMLQLGIGSLPSLTLMKAQACGKVAGVWSEVITDSAMYLSDGIPIVATFALGTHELYEWMNENPNLRMLPVEITNGQKYIHENNVWSVNSAMAVTYKGVTVVGVGKRFSGPGGAPDFGRAAKAAIIALRSSHYETEAVDGVQKKALVSNIIPGAQPKDHIVMPPYDRPNWVVTEQGAALLRPGVKPNGTFCDGSPETVTWELIENCVHPKLKIKAMLDAFAMSIPISSRVRPERCIVKNRFTGEEKEISFQPIEPSDEEAIKAMHRRHSPETIRKRFLGAMHKLPEAMAYKFANVAHDRTSEAIGAFLKNGDLVGVARYYTDKSDRTEFSIVVEDAWQRCGLGTRLMYLLTQLARKCGITYFTDDRLASNIELANFIERLGFNIVERYSREDMVSERWLIPESELKHK